MVQKNSSRRIFHLIPWKADFLLLFALHLSIFPLRDHHHHHHHHLPLPPPPPPPPLPLPPYSCVFLFSNTCATPIFLSQWYLPLSNVLVCSNHPSINKFTLPSILSRIHPFVLSSIHPSILPSINQVHPVFTSSISRVPVWLWISFSSSFAVVHHSPNFIISHSHFLFITFAYLHSNNNNNNNNTECDYEHQ